MAKEIASFGMVCIFCVKPIKTTGCSTDSSPLSQFLPNSEKDQENYVGHFVKLLKRYLGDTCGSRLEASNISGSSLFRTCGQCATILDTFCDIYHEIKCLELQLQWKVNTLQRVMTEAGRVPSRMRLLKKAIGVKDEGANTKESYNSFVGFREDLIRTCSRGLSKCPPQVVCRPLALDIMSSSEDQKLTHFWTEVNAKSQLDLSGILMSLAAVVMLLSLCPNHSTKYYEGCNTNNSIDLTILDLGNEEDNLPGQTQMQQEERPCANISPPPGTEDEDSGVTVTSMTPPPILKCDPENETAESKQVNEEPDDEDESSDTFQSERGSENDSNVEVSIDLSKRSCAVFSFKDESLNRTVAEDAEAENHPLLDKDIKHQIKLEKATERKQGPPLPCNYCSKSFPSKFPLRLRIHINRLHPEKCKYSCDVCCRGFSDYQAFQRHRKSFMHLVKIKKQKARPLQSKPVPKIESPRGPLPEKVLDNQSASNSQSLERETENEAKNDNIKKRRYNLRQKAPKTIPNVTNEDKQVSDDDTSNSSMDFSHDSRSTSSSEDDERVEPAPPPKKVKGAKKRKYSKDGHFRRCRTDNCKYFTMLPTAFKQHQKLHETGEFPCKFCSVVEDTAVKLCTHELKKHSKSAKVSTKSLYYCSRCPYNVATWHRYVNHFARIHLNFARLDVEPCPICQLDFPKGGLKQQGHFRRCHDTTKVAPEKILKCTEKDCSAYFISARALHKHRTVIHKVYEKISSSECEDDNDNPQEQVKCKLCKKEFESEYRLQKHKHLYHKKVTAPAPGGSLEVMKTVYGTFVCPVPECSKSFKALEKLDQHRKYHGSFKCQFCDVVKEYAPDLAVHEVEHGINPHTTDKKPKIYKCQRCLYSVSRENIIIRHYIEKHFGLNVRNMTCKICQAQFACKSTLRSHQKCYHTTTGVDPSKIQRCDQCPAYFLNRIQLIGHRKTIHEKINPLQCTICNKLFKTRESLRGHRKRMHWNGKSNPKFQFPCDLPNCKDRFRTSDELEWHKAYDLAHRMTDYAQKQASVQMRICSECGKECKGEIALKVHMKVHLRPSEFKCEECGKAFKLKEHLNKHKLYHKGPDEWEYMCAVCSKKCVDKYTLKAHMTTHSKEKPFVCQVCGEKYAHRHNLRNHVNTKHKVEGVQDLARKVNRKSFVSRKGKKLTPGFCFTSNTHNESE